MLKNWQHNVILQSAGSGFLTNQENVRVRGVTKSYVICYTRPFLRSSSSCYSYSRLVKLFSHRLPSHIPADCISRRLLVFNLLLLSVWWIFYPHLSWRDFVFKSFSNKTVTFVAIYPKQLFIVRCPTFVFSKRVQSLVELWIYFNCGKCLAVKEKLRRQLANIFIQLTP